MSEVLAKALLCAALLFGGAAVPGWAGAADRPPAKITLSDDGRYLVDADFDLDLNERLADAVARGVSLYFTAQFELERARWWWFDKKVLQRNISYRLSYHAITRSYRLSIGSLHRNYDSLDAALATMTRIRNWHVADADTLEDGTTYEARIRLHHDRSMLPRPFQLSPFGSREWTAGTDWFTWTFRAGGTR